MHQCGCEGLGVCVCVCVWMWVCVYRYMCEGVPESVTATTAGDKTCQNFSGDTWSWNNSSLQAKK